MLPALSVRIFHLYYNIIKASRAVLDGIADDVAKDLVNFAAVLGIEVSFEDDVAP